MTAGSTPTAPTRPSRFLQGLHASYAIGTGISHWLQRRVCPAGIGTGVVLVIGTTLAMGQPRDSVNAVCALATATGLLGLGGVCLRRARLSAERDLPRLATVGEPVAYTVRLHPVGRRRIQRAWLLETPPDPRPTLTEFASRPEPGEERRNRFDRRFIYYRWQWLMACKRAFSGGDSPTEIRLSPGKPADIKLELIPRRRGVIPLNDLRVLLPDPLGLFQRCRKVPAPPATLTVLPRRYRLPPIELPGSARFEIGGDATGNTIGTAGEFIGLREYRKGDSMRQIHWKSWARMGKPIVKELEDTHYPRHGLVLDTFATDEALFEDALSVAASFAATIDTHESLLDLMFIGDRAHIVTAGRGLARAEKLLEALAAVQPSDAAGFEPLLRLVLRHREQLTSCLVVLAGWDDRRAAFLTEIAAGGVQAATLIIGHGPPPPGIPGHWLESGQLARDLLRLPGRLAVAT